MCSGWTEHYHLADEADATSSCCAAKDSLGCAAGDLCGCQPVRLLYSTQFPSEAHSCCVAQGDVPRVSIVKAIEKQMGALDLMVQAIESYAADMHGLKVRLRPHGWPAAPSVHSAMLTSNHVPVRAYAADFMLCRYLDPCVSSCRSCLGFTAQIKDSFGVFALVCP